MTRASREVLAQLVRMGVNDWNVVISTNVELRLDGLPRSNQRTPDDPGAAVYFRMGEERRVLACDQWDRPEHNLWAIAKHLDAIRGMERWGVGTLDQAFRGYAALPEEIGWRSTLGLGPDDPVSAASIHQAYRKKALDAHPDRGGSSALFSALTRARDRALEEIGEHTR